MKKLPRPVQLAALATALTTAVLVPGTASAHPAPVSSTVTVVATGLATPRGLIWDDNRHRVLVAEAGEGGTGPCGPANGGGIYCYGPTGAVFQYTEHGQSPRRIATGLPSIIAANGSAVLGVHDLALDCGELNLVFGLSGNTAFRTALGPNAKALAQTAKLDNHGRLKTTGDLMAFEQTVNPHPFAIDSDPFGIAVTHRYGTVVADAAGNDILQVKPNGQVKLIASFPTREVPNDTIEPVPTTVAEGPDGALYVGELSGYPYYKGAARVYRIAPGHAPTIYAQGFTNIADLTFDDRGRLVVLEMAKNGLLDPDQTGRLVRVERNGTQVDLATTGLTNPGGVAYAGNGVYYVTNKTTVADRTGELLKVKVRG